MSCRTLNIQNILKTITLGAIYKPVGSLLKRIRGRNQGISLTRKTNKPLLYVHFVSQYIN